MNLWWQCLVATCCVAGLVHAQPTTDLTREFLLTAQDQVQVIDIGPDKVQLIVDAPSIAPDQWRFFVRAPKASESVVLKDTAAGTELVRISVDKVKRGVWSPLLRARSVFFDIDEAASPHVQMLGYPVIYVGTQTPVGETNVDLVADREMGFELRQLTEAVGQLAVVEGTFGSNEQTFFTYCTVFLVGPTTALTAEHCVARGLEDRFAQVTFGFLDADLPQGAQQHDVSVRAASSALDVAVLDIAPESKADVYFDFAQDEPPTHTPLLVLQHFGGSPLSISDDARCLTTGSVLPGPLHINGEEATRLPDIAFGHGCDTTKSSSGAPILDRESLHVIGLHQRGFSTGEVEENRGLRIDALRAFLEENATMETN